MKCVRAHRRTAVVGVTMYDLGIMADALGKDLAILESSAANSPNDFRPDRERLYRQVTATIAAMDDYADRHPAATT